MNRLPGKAYPKNIGGIVDTPAFVFHCGDITEWPTHQAKKTYEDLITKRLRYPSYEILVPIVASQITDRADRLGKNLKLARDSGQICIFL